MPARTIDCWSCDAPNSPGRMFCVSCGSFIAIGSKTRPTPESAPFSGPPPVPGDADVDVSLPYVEGVSPLGSYSLEAQRRATRRTRTMTAVTSIVLAMVIGGAALYLASPMSQRSDAPQTAVVAPSEVPQPTDQTRGVSGVSIQPEAAEPEAAAAEPEAAEPEAAESDAEQEAAAAEPEAAAAEPEAAAAEPDAESEELAEPEAPAEPEPEVAEPEAPAEPEPVPVVAPGPAVEEDPVDDDEATGSEVESGSAGETVTTEPTDGTGPVEPDAVTTAPDEAPPVYDGSWVCGEEIVIEDIGDRGWSISHVSFRVRDGFERVILHLDKVGKGSGDPTTITADSMRNDRVRSNTPAASAPGLGRRSVTLRLEDGFYGMRGLNAYRPTGVGIIKEFSLYSVGRDGRSVVISGDTDGCYRVRVPGWSDPSGSLRRAEIHVDIKP